MRNATYTARYINQLMFKNALYALVMFVKNVLIVTYIYAVLDLFYEYL